MTIPNRLAHDWFPAALPANVEIGKDSWCYSSFCCLHFRSKQSPAVRIGEHSGIYHGTFFDLGEAAQVEIGNYSSLGGVIISSNSRIIIGSYTFIAHEVVLADSVAATPLHARDSTKPLSVSIEIGDNVWIGTRAILLQGARIGEGAIIGAAAVVDFAVPAYAVVGGNPAKIVGWSKPTSP